MRIAPDIVRTRARLTKARAEAVERAADALIDSTRAEAGQAELAFADFWWCRAMSYDRRLRELPAVEERMGSHSAPDAQ